MTAKEQGSLKAWDAIPSPNLPLEEIINLAFEYRGDVTLTRSDGTRTVGYVFNRDDYASQPFVQLLPASGEAPITIPYSDVKRVQFTGKDTAAGNSYEAWKRRKESQVQPAGGES